MGPIITFQYMAATAFIVVGLNHLVIWARGREHRVHLLFGLTALCAAGNGFTMTAVYRAASVAEVIPAFRHNILFAAFWLTFLTWFIAAYSRARGARAWFAGALTATFLFAIVVNYLTPGGWIFSEITGVRETYTWGERIAFPDGTPSPWRYLTDLAQLGMLALAIDGALRLRRLGERRRAIFLGFVIAVFMVSFDGYGLLLDLGYVEPPYWDAYGFLIVAFAMSFELGGEVVRAGELAREVQSNEERWRTLLENVRLPVAGLGIDGRIDYANPSFQKLTGYADNELCGRPYTSLLPGSEAEEVALTLVRAQTGRIPENTERVLLTKDGSERRVQWSNVLLTDAASRPAGILSIGSDVTEQRRAEGARDRALAEIDRLKARLEEENLYLKEELSQEKGFGGIVGESNAIRYVLSKIKQVAATDANVLILGATGSGKELVARAIHEGGKRRGHPFITVNCSALSASLVESELFGHERGAFTGADRRRQGRFELAQGGTLFLDEVGEIPPETQAKLLRVLQEGEFERVGGTQTLRVDVRIIAATNRDLAAELEDGRFRPDLFYRLNVFPITVPPLRNRREDIPLLVRHFVAFISARMGRRIEKVPGTVMFELTHYDWPGNVRELENVIERAIITSSDGVLRLPEPLTSTAGPATQDPAAAPGAVATLEELERAHIRWVLERTGGQISGDKGAAALLGINPSTLRSRMKKLGLR